MTTEWFYVNPECEAEAKRKIDRLATLILLRFKLATMVKGALGEGKELGFSRLRTGDRSRAFEDMQGQVEDALMSEFGYEVRSL